MKIVTDDNAAALDGKEKAILKLLQEDGRARIVDIANKLGISAELALYKVRKLLKEKVILGSRIQFDMSKLGYYFTVLSIYSCYS